MNMKTSNELDNEANSATAYFGGAVLRLLDDGVEPAALAEALAAACGVMLAAAPRHMAAALDVGILARIRSSRSATWAAVDAAATVQ